MQNCYCGRKINPNGPSASFFEEEYCSDYCRRYEAQGLKKINGEEKYGKSQFSGFNWMPIIMIPCEMCESPVELRYELEGANRQFCSMKCHKKMATTRRKAQITYAILRLLRHNRNNRGAGWMSAEEISRNMKNRSGGRHTSRQMSSILTKWISRGVVEITHDKKRQYRLKTAYLTGPLAKYYHEHDKPQLRGLNNEV